MIVETILLTAVVSAIALNNFETMGDLRRYNDRRPTEQELREWKEQKRKREIEAEALKLANVATEKNMRSIDDAAFLPQDVRADLEKSLQADNYRKYVVELQRKRQ